MTKSMQMLAVQILGLLLLLSSPALKAATVIEGQSSYGRMTVLTDGKRARMEMPGDEYVIVDYSKHMVKVVNPKKQQVMLLDADEMAAGNAGPQVRTAIKNLGAGIEVAGHPTQKYAYSANGKSCGVIYGSRDVYQKQGIRELFQAMQTMIDKQRALLGGLAGMIDDCTLAEMQVSDHVKTVGVPMRTEKNGRIKSEIKSIKYDVAIPADTFVIPAAYKTTTVQDQVKAASQGMAQRQSPPQMQEMMRQMQQSGQLTPQMMEQMRRGQQMKRQYQQPRY